MSVLETFKEQLSAAMNDLSITKKKEFQIRTDQAAQDFRDCLSHLKRYVHTDAEPALQKLATTQICKNTLGFHLFNGNNKHVFILRDGQLAETTFNCTDATGITTIEVDELIVKYGAYHCLKALQTAVQNAPKALQDTFSYGERGNVHVSPTY